MRKPHTRTNPKANPRPPIPPEVVAAYRLQVAGRFAEAEAGYRAALAANPDQFEALELLATLCRERGNLGEALRLFAATMKADRGSAEAASNHGLVLNELNRPAEALASLDRALILKPDLTPALYNRGNALLALGRFDEALRSYDLALARDPSHVDAHYNRGNALRELRRHDESLAAYRRALALAPARADIRVNEALTLLSLGHLGQGFREYEWRRHGTPAPAAPQWRGDQPIEGKTILLHAEQGFGDTLQFIRYAPLLARRGATVLAAVPAALKPLIAAMPDVTALTAGDAEPGFDLHCPMLSLPLAFGTELATIPAQVPYLRPAADRTAYWSSRLPATAHRRVGIVWAGSAGFAGDRHRSLAFGKLAALLATPDVAFVGLQRDVPVADVAAVNAARNFVNLGPELVDFADTAALVSQLDLVIGVDTALVHLAGALAKPVWVLLPVSPDFRWLLDRPDSPWYPTARLFRQTRHGDWDEVLARVAAELSGIATAPARDADPGAVCRQAAEFMAQGRYREALAAWNKAVAAAPACAEAHNGRGTALVELGRFEEAHAAYERAVAITPDFSAAIYNQGQVELTLGRFATGWPKYERRFAAHGVPPPAGMPRWTGEPLAGKTLLIEAEQGYGDSFQFCRYAPLAAAAGARVILSVPRQILPVMKTLAGVARLMCAGETLPGQTPAYDFACPLLSLPLGFGTEPDTIPADIPYLAAERERVAYWRSRLPDGPGLKIGLAWSGTRSFAWSGQRSIPLALFDDLLRDPRHRVVSLQRDIVAGEDALIRGRSDIIHFGTGLRDFADTAAIIDQLDVVISIDTAVAHLAGAMGRPVWILLPFVPDFRWMLDRDDSPWYPTARLFRQRAAGDWADVVRHIGAALRGVAK